MGCTHKTLNQWIATFIVCLGPLFICHDGVWAHPHVFIVERITMVFDDEGLAGFRIQWEFDEMFTAMIAGDHDRNRNNTLEPLEVAAIEKNAFAYTAHQDYFTFIRIDSRPFKVRYVTDFSARLVQGRLIYEFLVPCHVRAAPTPKQVVVASYDPTYYSAIFFAEDRPASLENGDPFGVKSAIREDTATSIYFGMVHPWALFLEFGLKP